MLLPLFTASILAIFSLGVSYIENVKFDTYITPFGVMVWPYTIVVLSINIVGLHFGFLPVSILSVLIMILHFIFFYIGGYIVLLLYGKHSNKSIALTSENIDELLDIYRPLFVFLAIISIITGLIHLNQSLNEVGGIINIATQDFDKAYGTGILSHFQNLGRLSFIFLVGDYIVNKKKYILALLMLVFFVIFIRLVKYHIFGIVLGAYFFCLINGIVKFSIKKVLTYSIAVLVLFGATYYVGFLTVGLDYTLNLKTNVRFLNLFFTYLFGPPIAFSEILHKSIYPIYSYKEIFAVPINLYKTVVGDNNLINIIIQNWVPVSTNFEMFHYANVFGAVGMLFMYLGISGSLIFMFFLGVIITLFWQWALKVKYAIGVQLVYSLLMAFLTVSFFDLYFNKLATYESTIYMLLIPIIYMGFYKVYIKANKNIRT